MCRSSSTGIDVVMLKCSLLLCHQAHCKHAWGGISGGGWVDQNLQQNAVMFVMMFSLPYKHHMLVSTQLCCLIVQPALVQCKRHKVETQDLDII